MAQNVSSSSQMSRSAAGSTLDDELAVLDYYEDDDEPSTKRNRRGPCVPIVPSPSCTQLTSSMLSVAQRIRLAHIVRAFPECWRQGVLGVVDHEAKRTGWMHAAAQCRAHPVFANIKPFMTSKILKVSWSKIANNEITMSLHRANKREEGAVIPYSELESAFEFVVEQRMQKQSDDGSRVRFIWFRGDQPKREIVDDTLMCETAPFVVTESSFPASALFLDDDDNEFAASGAEHTRAPFLCAEVVATSSHLITKTRKAEHSRSAVEIHAERCKERAMETQHANERTAEFHGKVIELMKTSNELKGEANKRIVEMLTRMTNEGDRYDKAGKLIADTLRRVVPLASLGRVVAQICLDLENTAEAEVA